MELHALTTGRQPRVVTAMTMLKQRLFRCVVSTPCCPCQPRPVKLILSCRHHGQIGAALVLGGVDPTGPHLFTIHPHGSTDKLPYVTMGSGSLAAMAVFESQWRPDMEVRNSICSIAHTRPRLKFSPDCLSLSESLILISEKTLLRSSLPQCLLVFSMIWAPDPTLTRASLPPRVPRHYATSSSPTSAPSRRGRMDSVGGRPHGRLRRSEVSSYPRRSRR